MAFPIFLSSPVPVIPPFVPEPSPWLASQHVWTDFDGNDWDLSHGTSGLALQTGVRGMHMPPIIRYASKAPAVAGSLWRGSVTDEREAFWPIRVFNDNSSLEWIAHNRRFWETLTPDKTGRWSVVQPDGDVRWLTCRFSAESDDADDIEPELQGWALYGITLIAERPYWEGPSIVRAYGSVPGQNYYGGDAGGGFGPPFVISEGATISTATIVNPGQVGSWPVWTVYGPFTSAQVGLNGRYITFPFALAAGQYVRIDTDPTSQIALDQAGVDRTAQLTSVAFTEIPPGVQVPLQMSMTGTGGSIQVALTPRYYRAM